jgi:hypothetical protein
MNLIKFDLILASLLSIDSSIGVTVWRRRNSSMFLIITDKLFPERF